MNYPLTTTSHNIKVRLRTYGFVLAIFLPSLKTPLRAAGSAAGFVINDTSHLPSLPAFYNETTNTLDPITLQGPYADFIDFVWDADRSRLFFSARRSAGEPFYIFMKEGLDGPEQPIYENPVGPFRFLLSPDGRRLVLQIMGPSTWPILAVHDWNTQHTVELGQGYSPDWSPDSSRLLYLHISDALPASLWEYRVDTDTTTRVLPETVVEAAYAQDAQHLILKTTLRAKRCDMFELWDRSTGRRHLYSPETLEKPTKACLSQREIGAFPGHRFLMFKESTDAADRTNEKLIVVDGDGGRLVEMSKSEWEPEAIPMDPTSLVVGQEPLYLLHADGAGGRVVIPHGDFIRPRS